MWRGEFCGSLADLGARHSKIIKAGMQHHTRKNIVQAAYNISVFLYHLYSSEALLASLSMKSMWRIKKPHFLQVMEVQVGDRLGTALKQCLQSLWDIIKMQNRYKNATDKLTEAQKMFVQVQNRFDADEYMLLKFK